MGSVRARGFRKRYNPIGGTYQAIPSAWEAVPKQGVLAISVKEMAARRTLFRRVAIENRW